MLPPPASQLAMRSKMASLASAFLSGLSRRRTIGTASAASNSHDSPGISHSVLLAIGEMSHGAEVSTKIGSMSPLTWFDTNRRPPVLASGSVPVDSTLRK